MDKQNGFVSSPKLAFGTSGIDMNFGISHLGQFAKKEQDETLQQQIAKQEQKYTPNRLASEQEFGQTDCALNQVQIRKSEIREDDSLIEFGADGVSPRNLQRGHIFCKKEVMTSVNRVL